MRNNLEEFLKDDSRNKEIFEDGMQNKYTVYKEDYNDRFQTIYYKHYSSSLSQSDYKVGGIYDREYPALYNPDYTLMNLFSIDNNIKTSYLSNIENRITEEINKKVNTYLGDNFKKLKQYGRTKFDYLNEYDIRRVKEEINKAFIIQEYPTVSMGKYYSAYDLHNLKTYKENDIYIEYLKNPKKVIDDFFNEIKDIKKEELGFEALMYEYKVNYLHELVESNSPLYRQMNINRNIYQSIKDVYARNITINIGYGDNNMNFKFDIDDLKNSLARGDSSTRTYGIAYRKVADFIKDNDLVRDGKEDFEFSHINFITHGKEEIYNKNNFEKEVKPKSKDRGDR